MYLLAPDAEKRGKCKCPSTGRRIRLDPSAESITAEGVVSAKTDSICLRKIEAKIRVNPNRGLAVNLLSLSRSAQDAASSANMGHLLYGVVERKSEVAPKFVKGTVL
jgi:hypothetical protein